MSISLAKSVLDAVGQIAKEEINPQSHDYFEVIINEDLSTVQVETVLHGRDINAIVSSITAKMDSMFDKNNVFISSHEYLASGEEEAYYIPDALILRVTIK